VSTATPTRERCEDGAPRFESRMEMAQWPRAGPVLRRQGDDARPRPPSKLRRQPRIHQNEHRAADARAKVRRFSVSPRVPRKSFPSRKGMNALQERANPQIEDDESKVGNFDWGDTLAARPHNRVFVGGARNNALAPTQAAANPMSKQARRRCRRTLALRAARWPLPPTISQRRGRQSRRREAPPRVMKRQQPATPAERQRPRAGRGSVIEGCRPRPASRA